MTYENLDDREADLQNVQAGANTGRMDMHSLLKTGNLYQSREVSQDE
jgi:hypothetical protein